MVKMLAMVAGAVLWYPFDSPNDLSISMFWAEKLGDDCEDEITAIPVLIKHLPNRLLCTSRAASHWTFTGNRLPALG
jgi:hypothetical protein